jgi:hypothetical protein
MIGTATPACDRKSGASGVDFATSPAPLVAQRRYLVTSRSRDICGIIC